MATQQTQTTGRNRGARKQADENPKANIGSHMTGKDQTPAIKTTAQDDPKIVQVGALPRPILDKAGKIVGQFHAANDELQTLKDDIDRKRGGLSDIVFQLCKLGAEAADKETHRLAYCHKVFGVAEAYERQRWQKAHKLAELPTAKEALGASWQTYKSQILRCVAAGLNPIDFANGTAFREAASKTGNQARRTPRQTKGATTETEATALDQFEESQKAKGMRPELAAALKQLIAECQGSIADKQMDYAGRISRVAIAIAKDTKKATESTTPEAQEQGATEMMQ